MKNELRTSQQWWDSIKGDESKVIRWLQKQCYGEYEAWRRISELFFRFNSPVLDMIAKDEYSHYIYIKNYLESRGHSAYTQHEVRYWKEIPKEVKTIEEVGAIGHLAEAMRLERIEIIANDMTYPALANLFTVILYDERMHVKAFKHLTNDIQIELARADHEAGMRSIGLTM